MRRAHQRTHDLELALVTRAEYHHDVRGQAVLTRQRMALGPAVVDHAIDDGMWQRHVQAAISRRVQVGKLTLDHETGISRALAGRQVKRAGSRNRNVAGADDYAGQLTGQAKQRLLQRSGRYLVELGVRIGCGSARARATAPLLEVNRLVCHAR